MDKDQIVKQNDVLEKRINLLAKKLGEKDEELAISKSDRVRFKELSEGYM